MNYLNQENKELQSTQRSLKKDMSFAKKLNLFTIIETMTTYQGWQ